MSNLSPPPSREKLPVVKDQGGKLWAEFPLAWQKWFSDIKELLAPVATSGLFPWSSISKIGSNLTDLLTRNHADLQNINTATYTHLSSTQATDLTDGGNTTLHVHDIYVLDTEKGSANGVATLGVDSLIPVTQLPPSAYERMVIVADQTARYALTIATVQNGDTVKQSDTGEMWFVIDDTNLGNSAGYAVYTAGTASAVALSGVTGLGTGVATALAVNVGTAGAPVVNGGALGTPSSGTLTNATGLPAAGVTGTALVSAAIGTTVQAYDAQLADIAGLTPTDNGVIIGNGLNFVVESGATLKTSLGLTIGTDVQAYDADLTTWAGVTPGAGVTTFLATPTLANLNSAVSDANLARTDAANSFTGIQTITDLAAGFLVKGEAAANEGGQFLLEKPTYAGSTTTLVGNVVVDINTDSLRVFDAGGTNKGFYINLAGCAAGAATQLATGGGTVTGASSGTNTGDNATNSQYSGLAASKQDVDATLTSIAALGTAADKMLYTTATDTWAESGLTAAARTVLDDASVSAMVDTLGGASSSGTGGLVRTNSPSLVTPALGTPSALVGTNITGTAAGLTTGGNALLAGSSGQAFSASISNVYTHIQNHAGEYLGVAGNAGYNAFYGGADYNTGAGFVLYGTSHATSPNVIQFTNGAFVERMRIAADGSISAGGTFSASRLISTVATGTAPLTVSSTTEVANLKAAMATLATTATNLSGGTVAATTISASGLITATGGQIAFPATQVPSADANTLDDYEEGTWTPNLTFDTPGNLGGTLSTQLGYYTKVGRLVTATFKIQTSSFTHSTASGSLVITGLPHTAAASAANINFGAVSFQGITKTNYTQIISVVAQADTKIYFSASGSGVGVTNVLASDMPTGGTILLASTICYFV